MGQYRLWGVAVVFMLLLAVPQTVLAADSGYWQQMQQELRPLEAYVVMPAGQEFLLDVDADQGVVTGDLFALQQKGKAVVHPKTEEVLGHLHHVKAVLRITKVKQGYSYARPLRGAKQLKQGQLVKRYQGLSAVFKDQTGQGEGVSARLHDHLEHLEWQDAKSQQADLFFVLSSDGLKLRDSQGRLIRQYALPPAVKGAAAQGRPRADVVGLQSQAKPQTPPAGGGTYNAAKVQWQQQSQSTRQVSPEEASSRQAGNVAYEEATPASGQGGGLDIAFPHFNKLGHKQGIIWNGDFLTRQGQLQLAAAEGQQVAVYNVTGNGLQQVAAAQTKAYGKALAAHWWQPQGDASYVAVVLWQNKNIQSALYRLQQGHLKLVAQKANEFWAGVDYAGDPRPETLLAQDFDREDFFGNRVRRASLQGSKVTYSPFEAQLPRHFCLQTALFADLTGDGRQETVFQRHGRLFIYQGTEQLYQSSQEIGGSLAGVTYEVNPGSKQPVITDGRLGVPPQAADLDGDGRPELLALAAEGGLLQNVGFSGDLKHSWVAVFKFDRGMFMQGTLGDRLQQPLQGLTVDQGQALLVAIKKGNMFKQSGQSYVLGIPLRRQ